MYTTNQIKEAWKLAKQYQITYFGGIGTNIKTSKSDAKTDFLTYLIYLAPHNQSGYNTCPMASNGCAKACLYTAGHGRYQNVQRARIRRTRFYFEHRNEFKACVFSEIVAAKRKAEKEGKKLACRLNGTSDIVWERVWPEVFEYFHDVQFYEYTKIWSRLMKDYNKPKNLYLTLSRSESNQKYIELVLKNNPKANVAAVFDALPDKWMGKKVINGDDMDLRILDPKGVIVGLKIKGRARYDESGFVIKTK